MPHLGPLFCEPHDLGLTQSQFVISVFRCPYYATFAYSKLNGPSKSKLGWFVSNRSNNVEIKYQTANLKIRPHVLKIIMYTTQFLFNDTMNMCQPSCDQNHTSTSLFFGAKVLIFWENNWQNSKKWPDLYMWVQNR